MNGDRLDHAEAHERLADLALEPTRLERLWRAGAAESRAAESGADGELIAHIERCETCADDLAGWRRTWAAVGAVGQPGAAGELAERTALAPPERLRSRTLAAIRADRRVDADQGSAEHRVVPLSRRWALRPRLGRVRGLVTAAAVLVAIVASGVAVQSRLDLQDARYDTTELSSTAAALDRILTASPHSVLALRSADGSAGGTLAWSPTEFVVLTSTLPTPAAGQVYRCWLQNNGTRTIIGPLAFSASTAAWSGSMSRRWDFAPGMQFGVSLYRSDGTSAPPVLVATL